MSKTWKVGDSIHVNAKNGGGQLCTVVGVNEQYLFLSYEIRYGDFDISAQVTVIERDSPRITSNPEKHKCNCPDCERAN